MVRLLAAMMLLAGAMARLTSADEATPVIPPDLPLLASPPNSAQWLREATILQPYGHSAYVALANPGDRPERLAKDFGFNTIIVQPTDSHNTIAKPAHKLTEEQFRAGIAAYRKTGYRILLYTSLMADGLSPEFQSGEIGRQHPDWLQRDPKGNPVLMWDVPWLCPSTGARQHALDRCLKLVKEYDPDGIMLDNNEFFFAAGGWTCHCDACTKGFQQYVAQRFGADQSKQLFGAAPEQLKPPTEEGPLHALWLHWRNRVWAEVNESFRARLRGVKPDIMFFANTQYLFDSGMLAADLQYAREDVLLSESCNLSSRKMSEKMVLGQALAAGRPLWNYVGTFSKPDDYTGLQPAETIGPWIAATLAHGARPWIVDGFDEGPTNPAARQEMSRLLSFTAAHRELYNGGPVAEVATIISPTSRDLAHRPLIPPHVGVLQSRGTPVVALRDDELNAEKLQAFKVLTIESAPCLDQPAVDAVIKWVRNGGMLIANTDTATLDELGRPRKGSLLWQTLRLESPPEKGMPLGRGAVFSASSAIFAAAAAAQAEKFSFVLTPESGAEVVPYKKGDSLLLHLVRHTAASKPIRIRVPSSFSPSMTTAELFIPGQSKPTPLTMSRDEHGFFFDHSEPSVYSVVRIPITR
jgi:hypothetical protein